MAPACYHRGRDLAAGKGLQVSNVPTPRSVTQRTTPSQLVRLDDALDRSAQFVSLEELAASGVKTFRVFQRRDLLANVLHVVEAFVEERIRQAQDELAGIVERRERDARDEGTYRVLSALAELGDLVDALLTSIHEPNSKVAAKAVDQRIAGVFRTHGVQRIHTIGHMFDSNLHEVVDEIASDKPEGTILTEVARGYVRGAFVLRVARVHVSSGKQEG